MLSNISIESQEDNSSSNISSSNDHENDNNNDDVYYYDSRIKNKSYIQTFQTFYQEVMKDSSISLEQNVCLSDEIKLYFTNINQIMNKTNNVSKITGGNMMKLSVVPLVQMNEMMLETICNNNVYHWNKPLSEEPQTKRQKKEENKEINPNQRIFKLDKIGTKFYSLDYSSNPKKKILRNHIIIRQTLPQELNNHSNSRILTSYSKTQELIPFSLPSYRFIPWLTISFIKFKHCSKNIESNTTYNQQVFSDCGSILHKSPSRTCIFACLYNIISCKFFALIRNSDHSLTYFISGLIQGESVIEEMTQFIMTKPVSLGFIDTFPLHIVKPNHVLGRGSTACVLACENNQPSSELSPQLSPQTSSQPSSELYPQLSPQTSSQSSPELSPVKISSNEDALVHEECIINHLTNLTKQSHIFLTNHLPSYQNNQEYHSGYRFFTKVYQPVSQLTREDILKLWEILKVVHQEGIVHCDIRFPNIMKDITTDTIIIIDWSSSRRYCSSFPILSYDESNLQTPTLFGASDGAVESIFALREHAALFPADDAYALIMLTLENCFNSMQLKREIKPFDYIKDPCYNPESVRINRKNCFSYLEYYISEFILRKNELKYRLLNIFKILKDLNTNRILYSTNNTYYSQFYYTLIESTLIEIFDIRQEIEQLRST